MPWGQLIAGPPGSGKTTYCAAMLDMLNRSERPTIVVNLDFANDALPYDCAVNACDLISLSDVMEAYELGPNGGLMYCLEYLEQNLDWLQEKLQPYADDGYYFLFDSPGQAELYTHHESLSKVVAHLQKLDYRLAAVHLVDSHHCTDPYKFVAAALVSLQAMVRLELPHLNVLSKCDIKDTFSKGNMGIDQFTDMMDLQSILPASIDEIEDDEAEAELRDADSAGEQGDGSLSGAPSGKIRPKFPPRTREFFRKFQKLNERIVEVVSDYNLVSFTPISVRDPRSLSNLTTLVDKAVGFVNVKTAASEKRSASAAAAGKEAGQTIDSAAMAMSGGVLEDDDDGEYNDEDGHDLDHGSGNGSDDDADDGDSNGHTHAGQQSMSAAAGKASVKTAKSKGATPGNSRYYDSSDDEG